MCTVALAEERRLTKVRGYFAGIEHELRAGESLTYLPSWPVVNFACTRGCATPLRMQLTSTILYTPQTRHSIQQRMPLSVQVSRHVLRVR